MQQKYSISIVLDKRFKKADGKYSVKLRMFTPDPRTQKLYATKFNYTEKDFTSIWETDKPRSEHKQDRIKLQGLLAKANEVADKLPEFSFKEFERLMFGKTNAEMNVNYYYDKAIKRHKERGVISSAKNYKNSLDCLLRFHGNENINFKAVTVSYLEQFEKYCTEQENKSLTTVGIYLRPLRTIFNDAISEKTILADIYPFGKRKYQIKAPKKVKKALSPETLKTLFEGEPATPEQQRAKMFWFFSYLCNGINIKDVLSLKWKDLDKDKLTFVRAKTAKSTNAPTPITVYLNDYTKQVIKDYGNTPPMPNNYIFPIFNNSQTIEEQYREKNNFIRSINQNFLKYAKALGIDEQISTYYARHSFSTMAIRKGKSIEQVGEALGHTDIKTTMNYFAGFEDKDKKDLSKVLLEF